MTQSASLVDTASWMHRIVALFIDWFASILVVIGLIGMAGYMEDPMSGFYVMGIFVLQSTLLIAVARGSFGQLVTGLRVVSWDGTGRPVGLLHALLRQVLIILVIPPLVFRPDGRGLHDLAVKTATVRAVDMRG